MLSKFPPEYNGEKMKKASLDDVIQSIRIKIGKTGKSIEDICREKGVNGNKARNYRMIIDGQSRNPGYNTVLELSRIFGCEHYFICADELTE
jgi:hypothetical protein